LLLGCLEAYLRITIFCYLERTTEDSIFLVEGREIGLKNILIGQLDTKFPNLL
jgi:hypothetical protein